MIGAVIHNRYRLQAELGRGGMGAVYRAHDTLLDRDVAVKVLTAAASGAEGHARLLREAQAVAQLDHPNIVAVYDAGAAEGPAAGSGQALPFIVMQLVEGKSLHARRPQTIPDIVAIARQICAALEHAHAHGIVHRDLKPENVLLAADGTAKLMDFGLARSTASRLTSEGTLVGTVFYLAPEQALGRHIDGRTDLYSLGVVLYELVAGRLPFTGDDPLAVISQHLYAPVVPPSTYNPETPPVLDALIVKLLAKDPADRLASAADVRQRLESIGRDSGKGQPSAEISPIDRIARGRLVGRERELAEAIEHWRRAVSGEAGEARVLLISGEPGIGKTRLALELMTQARLSGAQALIGECYAEGSAPYAPLAQIIQGAIADPLSAGIQFPDSVVADLLKIAPDLRAHLPEAPPNTPLDPTAEQRRLFENVVRACAGLTARQPLLLVIDDAHWADSGTLFLLRHLARRAARAKHPQDSPLWVLIVLTYREVDLDEARALNQVLLDLNRERLAARIKLSRFTADQTRDLLAALFQEEITPEFLEGIYRETEGNPFFVEEVCKALIEEGKVYREGGRWRRPSMDQIHIPQSVRVAIQARVAKLPEAAQETLQMAAILGRRFEFDTLRESYRGVTASSPDEEALIGALELAERAQLIGEVGQAGGGTFAFAHALIPAALNESVSGLRRRRLHRRAAAAIERLRPDDHESLAHHYGQAADDERAHTHYTQAGDRALATYANAEAERSYRAALELGGKDAARANLLAGLGEALTRQGRHEDAIQAWRDAIQLYQSRKDYEGVAQLYARSARAAWLGGDTPRGLALCREGLAATSGQPETAGMAALLHETGRACHFNGLPDEALRLNRQALEMAERLGEVAIQADTLSTYGLSILLPLDEAMAALRKAAELAESAGHLSIAARALSNLGTNSALLLGDHRSGREYNLRAAELVRRLGDTTRELHTRGSAIRGSTWLGDFAVAQEMLRAAHQLLDTAAPADEGARALRLVELELLCFQGEWAEAAQRLRVYQAEMRHYGDLELLCFSEDLLALVLLELDRFGGEGVLQREAEQALAEAIALNDRLFGLASSRCLLSAVWLRQGRLADSRHILAEAREKAGPRPTLPDEAFLTLAEARLAAAENRWPEALAAFEATANLEARMGIRWHRAQALCEWAEAHLQRNEPGDADRARRLLHEALAEYEAMNLPKYAAMVKERLQDQDEQD